MSAALFQQVLGAEFETLPPAVRALHTASGHRRYHGQVEVVRGGNPLARLFAWATRLPPAGRGEVEVEMEMDASGEDEKWTRHIGGHAMPSRLWERDGLLCEQLGLARFGFRLTVEQGSIVWRVQRITVLGLRLPARWFAQVLARESEADGRYLFDVAAAMPMIGLLVRYRGWLRVEQAAMPSRAT
ncbi:DUF4166 domain-containing protein [Pseudoxanthomonas sp. CF125]|uniref:DUF4166 domain-containing protein n=1 Tax=Pseudoxanthomonas sp. CF125 TaxID=1855303 RepID=UPI000888BECE|nr:DUF4166 domain-containing protein [Pseudoxanthomonas sp. CF125]SDQ91561.1 protein of unknown function [Pseudoxanthomonas sp. CF125]